MTVGQPAAPLGPPRTPPASDAQGLLEGLASVSEENRNSAASDLAHIPQTLSEKCACIGHSLSSLPRGPSPMQWVVPMALSPDAQAVTDRPACATNRQTDRQTDSHGPRHSTASNRAQRIAQAPPRTHSLHAATLGRFDDLAAVLLVATPHLYSYSLHAPPSAACARVRFSR